MQRNGIANLVLANSSRLPWICWSINVADVEESWHCGEPKKLITDKTTEATERASRWLWLRKEEHWRSYSGPGQE